MLIDQFHSKGYANEVGESFRAMISVNTVRASYAVAFGYVLLDCFDKVNKSLKREPTRIDKSVKTGVDCLIWQTSASVVIPGIYIYVYFDDILTTIFILIIN